MIRIYNNTWIINLENKCDPSSRKDALNNFFYQILSLKEWGGGQIPGQSYLLNIWTGRILSACWVTNIDKRSCSCRIVFWRSTWWVSLFEWVRWQNQVVGRWATSYIVGCKALGRGFYGDWELNSQACGVLLTFCFDMSVTCHSITWHDLTGYHVTPTVVPPPTHTHLLPPGAGGWAATPPRVEAYIPPLSLPTLP